MPDPGKPRTPRRERKDEAMRRELLIRMALALLAGGVVAGCSDLTQCQTDAECPEGAYCDTTYFLCFTPDPDAGSAHPSAPAELTAVPADGRVDLSWAPPTEKDLASYNVFWGTSDAALDQTTSVAAPQTAYSVSGLVNGTTYYFAVEAENTSGQKSPRSAVVSAIPGFGVDPGMLKGSLVVAGGAQYSNSATVELVISASPSEGATLAQMRFSNDGTTYGAPEPFSSLKAGYLLPIGDGEKTIYVEVSDSNGAKGVFTDTIVLDTGAPDIAGLSINNGAAATTRENVTLSFETTDSGSGVVARSASNDGISFSTIDNGPTPWTLTSGDGTKTVTVKVKDAAGNEKIASATILLDTHAPVITSAQLNGGAAWTRSTTANLAVVATDAAETAEICVSGGAVAQCYPFGTGTVSITLAAGDGQKNVQVVVKDSAGNQSAQVSASIGLDTTPPTLSSLAINGGAAYTNTTGVSVASVAADGGGSGVAKIAFETNSSGFGAPVAYSSPVNLTLPAGDGVKVIGAKVFDLAGNESAVVTDSITLDTTPATGTFVINSGNPQYTRSTGVTLVFGSSEATHFCAKLTNVPPSSASDACWTAMSNTNFNLSSGDGLKTVHVWFKNQANSFTTTAVTDQITLDTTPPSVSVSGAGAGLKAGASFTNATSVTFNNTASDATSGLAEVCVSTTANPPTSCVPYTNAPVVSLSSGDGSKSAYIRVRDGAGNFSAVATDTIMLDQTPPTLSSVTINGGQAYTASTSVNVTTSASDANGVETIELSNNGTVFASRVSHQATVPHTLSAGDGTKTVHARVTDVAGNVSPVVTATITLDTTPAGGTFVINSGDPQYANTPGVTLVFNASDATHYCAKFTNAAPSSAMDACWMAIGNTSFTLSPGDGPKTVYVWFKDRANNFNTAAVTDQITLDTTPPTVSVTGLGLGLKGGTSYTNTTTVPFNNSASDATSGVTSICVSTTVNPPNSCVAYSSSPNVTLAR